MISCNMISRKIIIHCNGHKYSLYFFCFIKYKLIDKKMKHICGRSHFEHKKGIVTEKTFLPELYPVVSRYDLGTINLYSSYLGSIPITAKIEGSNVYLESIYVTIKNRNVYLKVLDLRENGLNEDAIYDPKQLLTLKPVCINVQENKYKYLLTLICYLRINEIERSEENITKYKKLIDDVQDDDLYDRATLEYPNLFTDVRPSEIKQILQAVTTYNSRVDILFVAKEYLDFLANISNGSIDTVNNQDVLIFISGVPKLDNAYWNGQYMIFGEGDTMFYPLTSIDVIGHELSHGLVQGICDLEYKGHSGALNESYADILGTMLEFYIYNKYPNILGKSDWLIGEDLSIVDPCLRSMSDPNLCQQPCKMHDKYYVNPTSMIDYGGVHINSGIPNYCFYLISQKMDKFKALNLFLECLFKLKPTSDFFSFSSTLQLINHNTEVVEPLTIVELINKKQKPPILKPPIQYPSPISSSSSPYSNTSQFPPYQLPTTPYQLPTTPQFPPYSTTPYQLPTTPYSNTPYLIPYPTTPYYIHNRRPTPVPSSYLNSQYLLSSPSSSPSPRFSVQYSSPIPIQYPESYIYY